MTESQVHLEGRRPTWAEVDLDAIISNLRAIRTRIGSSRKILAVVKADAYGHGAVPVARRLEMEGIDHLGVAIVEEGMELRRAGISSPILILGAFDASQVTMIIECNLIPTVYSMSTLSAILAAGRRLPRPIPFHLKVDTGMGRLGMTPHELGAGLDRIAALSRPGLEGIYTTLANSEQVENPFTREQIRRLNAALEEARRRGLTPNHVHVANSGGILNTPESWFTMVRPGLTLYGLSPAEGESPQGMQPALSLRTRIVHVKTVPEGTPLGYGSVYRTRRTSRIATIGAGYDDGLNRRIHRGGEVLIRGRRAPFAGRISMDLAMVDVTEIDGAEEGDQVTVIGQDGPDVISAWELARHCGTIPWEILCGIGSRVPRVYLGEGAPQPVRSRFD